MSLAAAGFVELALDAGLFAAHLLDLGLEVEIHGGEQIVGRRQRHRCR
jgi:hypothetical protein